MFSLAFRAMGCQMQALLEADGAAAETAVAQTPGWFEDWEQHLSRFRPDSELSRLNDSHGQPVAVSAVLWNVLAAAVEAERESGGLVTPVLLAALEAAGYERSFETLALSTTGGVLLSTAEAPAPALAQCLWRKPETRQVSLLGGVRLDLGGVAKGWAAGAAAQRLAAHGPALVDAGGDVAVSGPRRSGEPWIVGVADPLHPDQDLATLAVSGGGVATSGRDYRRWRQGGAWQHHLIDPRTGRPAETDVLSATVVGPSAGAAEVAAKAALILGSQAGRYWLEQRPHLAGLLVLEDGRPVATASLDRYRVD